jgi:hypothetical protein
MTKRLNITSITHELEESAFFPSKKSPSSFPPPAAAVENPPRAPKPPLSERMIARTPVRPRGRRIITRNSFEIYEDQMEALRKRSLEEKMEGKLGSMSRMVREAIETYLQKSPSEK